MINKRAALLVDIVTQAGALFRHTGDPYYRAMADNPVQLETEELEKLADQLGEECDRRGASVTTLSNRRGGQLEAELNAAWDEGYEFAIGSEDGEEGDEDDDDESGGEVFERRRRPLLPRTPLHERLADLAEERFRVADELGLSAAGDLAKILALIEAEEYLEAAEVMAALDQRIEEMRGRQKS
ncbi:MAG: hypothetical protein KJ622_05385 [Alphaproteobacteria bacterium]|nr:hypothetical protein [Alphaproteobacteria bacterium]